MRKRVAKVDVDIDCFVYGCLVDIVVPTVVAPIGNVTFRNHDWVVGQPFPESKFRGSPATERINSTRDNGLGIKL